MDRNTFKNAVGVIMEVGVGSLVGHIINHNTPDAEELKPLEKVLITIGSIGLGGLTGAMANRWVQGTLEAGFKSVDDLKDMTLNEEEE